MNKKSMPVSEVIKQLERSLIIANTTNFVINNISIALRGIIDENNNDQLHLFMPNYSKKNAFTYKEGLMSEIKLNLSPF